MFIIMVLLEERYRQQAQPAGLIRALQYEGHAVRIVSDADDQPADPAAFRDVDVVVARGRSLAVLEMLDRAEAHRIPVIDSAQAVRSVRDKATMSRVLAASGLAVPRTWLGDDDELRDQLGSLAATEVPDGLLVKPVYGDNAHGVRRLDTASAVDTFRRSPSEGPLLVQEFIPGNGTDVKLYVIGDAVWAVRKPSPLAGSAPVAPEMLPMRPSWLRIARTCQDAFGLHCFGVDCVERLAPDGRLVETVVIEVNDFPNYTAVRGADQHLAQLVVDLSRDPQRRRRSSCAS
ncbi:ATP-grasp domain-containing protein [Citricoccus sp. NR2]|uniref:ATP-grasp domain-containing protein n=1 Tax=Citricoccus sp. NR2 TaxID=3004095 RepID=UPI0022DCE571|nr:hypothetical protein [Citricoccus sp. NR2]WBL17768.1 hypothetical protein O1A05_08065 [Citricoccus sp. NR2]